MPIIRTKKHTPPPPVSPGKSGGESENLGRSLVTLMTDPRTDIYLGRSVSVKLEVLAAVVTGQGTLAAIAARHGLSKQAMTRHARRARSIFG